MTRSPSLTASSVTRPLVSALMFTKRFGWILPDADTIASSLRFFTASVFTVMPSVRLNRKFANATPPSTTPGPAPIRIFFLRLIRPPKAAHHGGDNQRIRPYRPNSVIAIGCVALAVEHGEPDCQNQHIPDENRSVIPSTRPTNDFGSTIGSSTARLVALVTAPRK